MISISVVIYSYKNPKLLDVVENVFNTSSGSVHVTVYDQHPMLRKDKFSHLNNLEYSHIFWDKLNSPCSFKQTAIHMPEIHSEYTLILSDRIYLSEGWDSRLVEFFKENPGIISGYGKPSLSIKDKHFLEASYETSETFEKTSYANSELLFSSSNLIKSLDYPVHLKFYGENEYLSLDIFKKQIDLWSPPSDIIDDIQEFRPLEELYVPFSLEHKYNSVVESLKSEIGKAWGTCVGIDTDLIKPIFYQQDDVPYDPYDLKIVDVGGERFIGSVKAIY